MRVFLSWSGETSRAVALALSDWLPDLMNAAEPFFSVRIDPGSRWSDAIVGALDGSSIGVICVTRENQDSSWLNFEAGAIAKRVVEPGRAMPLAIDLEPAEIRPPLGLFQVKRADKEGIWEIVATMNGALDEPRPEEALRRLFDRLWPDLEKAIESARTKLLPSTSENGRSAQEMLEEILSTVRAVNSAVSSSNLADAAASLSPAQIKQAAATVKNTLAEMQPNSTLSPNWRMRDKLFWISTVEPLPEAVQAELIRRLTYQFREIRVAFEVAYSEAADAPS